MKRFLILLCAGLLASLGVGALFMASLLHVMLVYVSLLWIGIPAIGFCIVALLYSRASRVSIEPPLRFLYTVLTVGLFLWLSMPIGSFFQHSAIDSAKNYPAKIAPILEQFRQLHGSYPSSLNQLPAHPFVPRLLRSSYGYRSDGRTYSFCFAAPDGIIDSWDYNSETKQWHLSS